MNLFDSTIRPDGKLFYSRHDPNDPKMGEFVKREPQEYDQSEVVVLGSPQDEGVRRNKGRHGAREGPTEIRRALYRFSVPQNVLSHNIFDLGDIRIALSLEETHDRQEQVVRQIVKDGKSAIVLGGGNDISFPDCAALSSISDNILAFNIDSHFDVRADNPRNSGTPYRQLLEGGYIQPHNFFEMAVKLILSSQSYINYLKEKGVHVYFLDALREQGIKELFTRILNEKKADSIFWGFDIDAVRSADAPGVSASYPIGLSAEEVCQIAFLAGSDKRTRIIELSEVNPLYDLDGRTSRLAAMVILIYLNASWKSL